MYTIQGRTCLVFEGQQKVTSHSCHQSCVDSLWWRYNHASEVVPPFTPNIHWLFLSTILQEVITSQLYVVFSVLPVLRKLIYCPREIILKNIIIRIQKKLQERLQTLSVNNKNFKKYETVMGTELKLRTELEWEQICNDSLNKHLE